MQKDPQTVNIAAGRRKLVLNVHWITIGVWTFFAFYDWLLLDNSYAAIVESVTALILFINALSARFYSDYRYLALVLMTVISIEFLLSIHDYYHTVKIITEVYWTLGLPVTAFLVAGRRFGSLISVLLLASVWGLFLFLGPSQSGLLNTGILLEFSVTYAVVLTIGFFYEKTRTGNEADLLRVNDELQRANENKNRFFSIISHDLRGPVGNIAVLFDEIASGRTVLSKELITQMRNSTRSVYQLLEDLLNWYRSRKGQLETAKEVFNIQNAIDDSIAIAEAAARKKSVQLYARPVIKDGFVLADRDAVRTVLRNLISNAIKYTPENGTVEVAWEEDTSGMICVSVTDSGTGIPDNIKDKLFKENTTPHSLPGTNNEKGSGLGLILAREFTESCGGSISATSLSGKGSRFSFTLPASQEKISRPKTVTEQKINSVDYSGYRALIVEDNYLNLRTSISVMESLGIELDAVQTAEQAVAQNTENYDLVFMDIDLPGMNGADAARILKEKHRRLPVLALTSYEKDEVDTLFGPETFQGILNKPLDEKSLRLLLNRIPLPDKRTGEPLLSSVSLEGIILYVIDDDLQNHLLIEYALRETGMTVQFYEDPEDFLKQYRHSGSERLVILTDIEMPGMNGYETLEKFRELEKQNGNNKKAPVYAMTALNAADILSDLKHAGFAGCIEKPVTRRSLIAFLTGTQVSGQT